MGERKKKQPKEVTNPPAQTVEKQSVEDRRPVAPTNFDSEEISEPHSCPLVTRLCRGKKISESSDSESTIPMTLKNFVKRRRTQRPHQQMGWTGVTISSQPDHIPVSPTEAAQDNIFINSGEQERIEVDQIVHGGGDECFEGVLEFDAQKEHEGQKDPEITAAEREVSHYDPIPVEECFQLLIKSAWDNVSTRMTIFEEWLHFHKEVRIKDISSFEPLVIIEEHLLEWGETEELSDLFERRFLIMYKLFELELEKMYHEHLANFKLDVPSVNHDFLCIRRLHKELRAIATVHRDHRAMEGLPLLNQDTSYLDSASHQEQFLALEFSSLIDHEQGSEQAENPQ
ncbi:hypothetical protein F511_03569 [Dorcoceras hygrometricum]|uniref:Uncharacterized protein n=1 Tax=Dorcoceras hygrometricum TaxID=472368 RepID=A0A2Z7B082_9LAMI|nr:hypothetical protein F511_03569 [Dorcoceras hygrometricum]